MTEFTDCVYEGTLPVSVVVPCYQCATSIRRAVESVWRQSAKPSEVILVDDASSDGTLEVLRELERDYQGWIVAIELSKNSGPASARNVGWMRAKYPLIAFLDADDSWHPEKLRVQYTYMRDNPSVVASGHQCLFVPDGAVEPELLSCSFSTTPINLKSLLFKNAFSTPTAMVKREIDYQFPEKRRFSEDVFLWQQIAADEFPLVRIEAPLAFVHKQFYGVAGLSSNLWKMEGGELLNFVALYRGEKIAACLMVLAILFSVLKFSKRLIVSWLRNGWQGFRGLWSWPKN